MNIDVNMLCTGVEHRTDREIRGSKIVAPQNKGLQEEDAKLFEKRLDPNELGNGIGNALVLRLGTRMSNHRLLEGVPGDQVAAKENTLASRRTPIVRTPSPIDVGKGSEGGGARGAKMKTIMRGVAKITQNAFNNLPMWNPWSVHKLADLVNSKSKVWTCEGESIEVHQRY